MASFGSEVYFGLMTQLTNGGVLVLQKYVAILENGYKEKPENNRFKNWFNPSVQF